MAFIMKPILGVENNEWRKVRRKYSSKGKLVERKFRRKHNILS